MVVALLLLLDVETERQTTLPLFVHPPAHRFWLLFTRLARHPQRMIALLLLRKQRAPFWSFYLRNCSRRPMGDAALPIGKRLQNSLPEFRRCAARGVGFSCRS